MKYTEINTEKDDPIDLSNWFVMKIVGDIIAFRGIYK